MNRLSLAIALGALACHPEEAASPSHFEAAPSVLESQKPKDSCAKDLAQVIHRVSTEAHEALTPAVAQKVQGPHSQIQPFQVFSYVEAPIYDPLQQLQEPAMTLKGYCSGALVDKTFITAKHCLRERDYIAFGQERPYHTASDFHFVGDQDIALLDFEEDSNPCFRSPEVGEGIWVRHWGGHEKESLLQGTVDAERLKISKGQTGCFGEVFQTNDLLFRIRAEEVHGTSIIPGSSGATVVATKDDCVIGVVAQVSEDSEDALNAWFTPMGYQVP